jgi:O-methyltransferase involved in polyketide biosynthesis
LGDIPYAREVAALLHAQEAFERLLQDSQMSPLDLLWYAPIFEVRYKSVAAAIRKCGATQVLELASGVSLRGLAMTQETNLIYVDTDLEELTQEKAALIDELRRRHGLQPNGNLHLATANALERDQLQAAAKPFLRDRPIAVVNEGLFQYLSESEMETVAGNIRDLLAQYGGVWITPDFSLREDAVDVSEQQRRFRAIVAAATDRKLYSHTFDDNAQLQAFFDRLGLQARVLNQLDEAPDVVCMETLKLPQQLLDQARPRLRLWVLSRATP